MTPAATFRGGSAAPAGQMDRSGLAATRNDFTAAVQGDQKAEAERHSEGPVARTIEEYTAQIPSDVYLWAAGASILASVGFMLGGKKDASLFVGQWVPAFLLLGVYNKIVKVAGSDRVTQQV